MKVLRTFGARLPKGYAVLCFGGLARPLDYLFLRRASKSALPRPPQPPEGGKATARRVPPRKATPYLAVAVRMYQ